MIRLAVADDIPSLVALNAHVQALHAEVVPSLFRSNPLPEEVAAAFADKLADPASHWLLAEEQATGCGYRYARFREHAESWSHPDRRVCNIAHLVVHPDHRRKGIARSLVSAVVDEAARHGFHRIELDVWSFNTEARGAFRQLGFVVFNECMERMVTAIDESPAETCPRPGARVTHEPDLGRSQFRIGCPHFNRAQIRFWAGRKWHGHLARGRREAPPGMSRMLLPPTGGTPVPRRVPTHRPKADLRPFQSLPAIFARALAGESETNRLHDRTSSGLRHDGPI